MWAYMAKSQVDIQTLLRSVHDLQILCSFSDLASSSTSSEVVPYQSTAIVGGMAVLPCNTTAPRPQNPPILVIWYKNGGGDPVYR